MTANVTTGSPTGVLATATAATATLAGIALYPFKSFDPLIVTEATVLPSGALLHDRRWALMDGNGQLINGKNTVALHSVRASFSPDVGHITLTQGAATATFALGEDLAPLEVWLGRTLDREIHIRSNQDTGFPDDLNAPGPTIVSRASLRAVADWFPPLSAEEVHRRFRTNLLLEGVPAFWEDTLFGSALSVVPFSVGRVRFEGVNPCQRCEVPPRNPETGTAISGFQKQFARRRQATLPEWANASRFDHFYRFAVNTRIPRSEQGKILRVGDQVARQSGPQG